MMDTNCVAVHEKICSMASFGRYVIFSEDELYGAFPEISENPQAELSKALKNLTAEGLIDVKYSSGNMYCIAPLKRYSPPAETLAGETAKPVVQVKASNSVFTFLSAFAGGALGSIIICLLFYLT